MSSGQKTWRHARPHDLLLCCGRIHNIRKYALNAIMRRVQHFRKHKFDPSWMENLVSFNFKSINRSSDLHWPQMPKYPFKVGVWFLIPVPQLWFSVPKFCLRKSSWSVSAAPVTFIRASSTLVPAPVSLCWALSSSELSRLMESASLESESSKRYRRGLQITSVSKNY